MGLQTVLAKSDIAKGRYYHFGDMQMVVLPADEEYTIELTGTGERILELQFEEYEDGELVSERSHTTIPVTNQLTSNFTLTNVEDIGTIEIDTDGDGTNDVYLPALAQDASAIVADLEKHISTQSMDPFAKKIT